MKITYIGHSCFRIEAGGKSIVTDPYEKDFVPGIGAPDVEADEVLCSHDHGDHSAVHEVIVSGDKGADWPFAVTEFETYHDDRRGALRGMNTVRIIEAACDAASSRNAGRGKALRIAHMGDIGCALTADQLAMLKGVDVLLIPVGGFFTIDDKQAAEMTAAIAPRIVVPMHYRSKTFGFDKIGTADRFEELVKDAVRRAQNGGSSSAGADQATQVVRLTPLRSREAGVSELEI